VRKINKEKTMDAHHTASALISEITDLRAQLAGEKAQNARLQGLLNQETIRASDFQKNHCEVYRLLNEANARVTELEDAARDRGIERSLQG
jgi:hypothetical protein